MPAPMIDDYHQNRVVGQERRKTTTTTTDEASGLAPLDRALTQERPGPNRGSRKKGAIVATMTHIDLNEGTRVVEFDLELEPERDCFYCYQRPFTFDRRPSLRCLNDG